MPRVSRARPPRRARRANRSRWSRRAAPRRRRARLAAIRARWPARTGRSTPSAAKPGIARCDSLATLCETLKVLHTGGPLAGRRMLIMGASGGDMAMTADAARQLALEFPAFSPATTARLADILSERVTIANPFDFHTHIWFDRPRLRSLFSIVHGAGYDCGRPHGRQPARGQADPASYVACIEEFIAAYPGRPRARRSSARCRSPFRPARGPAVSLLESCPCKDSGRRWRRSTARRRSVRPGLAARPWSSAGRRPAAARGRARTLPEHEGKAALAAYGVPIPRSQTVAPDKAARAAIASGFPWS